MQNKTRGNISAALQPSAVWLAVPTTIGAKLQKRLVAIFISVIAIARNSAKRSAMIVHKVWLIVLPLIPQKNTAEMVADTWCAQMIVIIPAQYTVQANQIV